MLRTGMRSLQGCLLSIKAVFIIDKIDEGCVSGFEFATPYMHYCVNLRTKNHGLFGVSSDTPRLS